MSTSHAKCVFANSCLSTPRKATSRSSTLHTNDLPNNDVTRPLMPEDPLQLSLTPSTPYVHAIHPNPTEEIESDIDSSVVDRNEQQNNTDERTEYAVLFATLLESNALLLEEIKALKQQSTLGAHPHPGEALAEQGQLSQSLPPLLLRDTWVIPSHKQPSSYLENDVSQSWDEVVEDIEPRDIVEVSDDSSDVSNVDLLKADPFASPGTVAVKSMWDNFSVDEYSTQNDTEIPESPPQNKKAWTPTITVPEPFSMTIREANTPKQKSRSLRMAEEEQLHKAAEEEAELMKKFRASPVPASTFLPLYELVNAKNEQRREEIKRLSKNMLKANERPFNFAKRERELKQIKDKQAALLKQIEEKELKKNQFKARPIPQHIFSPLVDERIQEQEDYRKIKIQMRSEELLAKSKLPGTMQSRGQYYCSRKPEGERTKTGECPFHPNINGTVPDYDQAYFEFQKRLASKKQTKPTTVTEPFHLRTECTLSRKQQVMEDRDKGSHKNRWPFVTAKVSKKSPKIAHSSTPSSTYPAQMTQTALLRQSLAQQKTANDLQNKVNERDQMAERKQRQKQIKMSVAERSNSTAWLEEKKKQKLQEFQKLDKERQEQYQHQLNKMQERVESRPLLFEQTSQLSARRSAESKYRAPLKKAGLSHEEIQALAHN